MNEKTSLLSYIIAPKGIVPGNVLYSGANVPPEVGNCLPIKAIPPGTLIHGVGFKAGEGGRMARAAGI